VPNKACTLSYFIFGLLKSKYYRQVTGTVHNGLDWVMTDEICNSASSKPEGEDRNAAVHSYREGPIVVDTHAQTDFYRADGRSAPSAQPVHSERMTKISEQWRRQVLLRNATTLVATSGVASAMGFAYWAFAARLFSQQAVGYGAAAVSAMTLLGTIGMFGLGTVLIGELPRRNSRAGLVSAALLASGIGALVIGLGFAFVAPRVNRSFAHIIGTPIQATLFAVGVAITAISLVFDNATIGLLRSGLQLTRTTVFAAVKLIILPVMAFALHNLFGLGITLSWMAGTAVSLAAVAIRLRITGSSVLARPDWRVLRGMGRSVAAHNWLNLAIGVPQSLIPVLVTVVVSPSANAAFYIAWMLAGFLYIIPAALSTVLFAVASADADAISRKLRFTLRLSLLIGLPGVLALTFGAHLVLSMFGAEYARTATLPLTLLVVGYLPDIPIVHYIAVCRAAGKVSRAAAVLTAAATMQVGAVAVGGMEGGLKGLSVGLLGVYLVQGLVTAPTVFRAAVGHGRHRRPDRHSHSVTNIKSSPATDTRLSNSVMPGFSPLASPYWRHVELHHEPEMWLRSSAYGPWLQCCAAHSAGLVAGRLLSSTRPWSP
jgi:O-antigen/teichoic acid export membrane protein